MSARRISGMSGVGPPGGQTELMARYLVNRRGVSKARELIDAHQYRVRSRWADVQPRAAEQNAFSEAHGWKEYGAWHLAHRRRA